MPAEFSWTTSVWQAEVDAFGELHTTSLLRLLQEAATRASTAAGFDPTYYDRTGTTWLIRRTILERLEPVRYGDVLTVRTWIGDFRRVRSQREYVVEAAGRILARAASDWVFADRRTGRPRRIPEEWTAHFHACAHRTSVRTSFPIATPPSSVWSGQRRVELHELDALRHVNNANYVAYLEQATLDALHAHGWTFDLQLAASGRLRAVRHDVEYLDEARYGDALTVVAWPTATTPMELEHHVQLFRGERARPILQARSRYRWTSDTGETALPAQLRRAFATS
jgi:YbgC/YbaW family acyl-CoA thioester hydrolase